MKKIVFFLCSLGMFQSMSLTATTGTTTASTTITYTIGSIDAIAVSANPGPLNITTAVAGSAPTAAVDTTTTYAVTTNNSNRKITGALTSTMPTGVTFSVTMAAPTGATSAGTVNLSTIPASLVTGISNIAQGGLAVTYNLAATVGAGQVSGSTNTLTFTIGP